MKTEKNTMSVRSVTLRVITDKPVRKTPYQVKGVFMRQYSDLEIIPMMDGSLRNRFLYPRVQVKILNEQIYVVGIQEGVDPTIVLADRLDILDFGNITFQVFDTEVEMQDDHFCQVDRLIRYRFLTPWVALNQNTGGRYRLLNNSDRLSFLNRLMGQNIIFLAREMDVQLQDKIFTKVNVSTMFPRSVDEKKWGAFSGDFQTNFLFPNYLGIGNGITRGYGAIYGMFNPKSFQFNKKKLEAQVQQAKTEEQSGANESELAGISVDDIPVSKRRKKPINVQRKFTKGDHKKVLHEEFDIEEDEPVPEKQMKKTDIVSDRDDGRFNSPEFHKKQHKI